MVYQSGFPLSFSSSFWCSSHEAMGGQLISLRTTASPSHLTLTHRGSVCTTHKLSCSAHKQSQDWARCACLLWGAAIRRWCQAEQNLIRALSSVHGHRPSKVFTDVDSLAKLTGVTLSTWQKIFESRHIHKPLHRNYSHSDIHLVNKTPVNLPVVNGKEWFNVFQSYD